MFISYPHARFLSTFEGNKLNRGHLRRQSTQGWCHRPQGWRHHPRGVAGSAGQVDTWAPSLRRLTPQVVAQAGRPHCHLSGPAAQERVTTTSKRAHRPTRAQSGARAQNRGVNVQTLPTRRREQMPPPSIPTFPHQKAKKSHYQQHAVSYNPDMTAYCGLEELGLVAVLPGFAPLPDLAPLPDIGDFLNDTPPVIAYGAVAANPRRLARACGTNAS